ncbi:MAG TPA: ABC transporter permease [Candidatus Binataceae bacterium]|nr:ABC transporter permease [Candidatus Binataceae bacterium]
MRYELKIALRYLRARRKEAFISVTTIFTAVGVMIGVAALTITLSVMGGFEQSLKDRLLALSPQIQILNVETPITKYGEVEARAESVKGVSGADSFMVGQGMMSSGRGIAGVLVRGVEPHNPAVAAMWGRFMQGGGLDSLTDEIKLANPAGGPTVTAGTVVIGATLADKLKVHAGDQVRMVSPIISDTGQLSTKTADFVVGAIFESGMNLLDSDLVFMDLQRAQDFFGRPDRADGVEVRLVDLDQTARVTAALRTMFPRPYLVRNWIQSNQSASAGFEMLKRVYSLVLLLLIGVAAFNLVATLIMVVMEKRKDIAVLIAMGAKRPDVRLIFVLKGLLVGAAGTAGGLLLGAVGCFALARYHFIHIPRAIYGMSTLPIAVDPASFALVALASLLLCLVATFYPARQASREIPVEVFRS